MRALTLSLLLLGCEANPAPAVPYWYADASDAVDPYGDSEQCQVVVDPSVASAAKVCLNLGPGYVSIDGKCMTSGQAWKACKALTPLACYRLSAGACVLCLQPEAPP